MTLVKFNRNNNFPSLVNDFFGGNLMDSFFDDFMNRDLSLTSRSRMRTNFNETDSEYIMEMALPGMDKSDINIEIEGDYLKVSSKSEVREDNHWAYQSFNERVYLSDKVDKLNVTSKMDNGILTINLPKSEEVITKRVIEVN